MEINKLNQLLKHRDLLQQIGNKTFNFSIINKQNPIANIATESEANDLIKIYESTVSEIADLINNFYKKDL